MTKVSRIILFLILTIVSLGSTSCLATKSRVHNRSSDPTYEVLLDTIRLFDQLRSREVPIAIFKPKRYTANVQHVVIFSHGYGENRPGSYLAYSYLTRFLASKGFFVASIQHELPTDSLIPSSGIPQIVRRPFWDRGADNILFVINELKKSNPELDFANVALIGHSNGGDMVALFPQKYPNVARKIITLDNRRMALPGTSAPKVYSLRSSDQPADVDVLHTFKKKKRLGMTIIKLSSTKHNDMNDFGNEEQHAEINNYVLEFLRDR